MIYEMLQTVFPAQRLMQNEPMSRHTTFHVGGPADCVALPASEEELLCAIRIAEQCGVPWIIVGNGSNLLVRDGGIRGLVILLGETFARMERAESEISAQAGVSLARLSAFAANAGLAGLEFASGIPGTLGGGVCMNAGAYGGQLSDAIVSARVLLHGELQTFPREQLQMGYRTSLPLREGGIVLGARFALTLDDTSAIQARMHELNARRRDKQPLNFPSAGSTFKRPEGYFAAALIDQAGLKGRSVGGAQVSEKHAGFIINKGGATASDILTLMDQVQAEVLRQFGVSLEPEVRIVGE
ncbi:MAG: UDP-N-acetylmuramate dehydrogenase [Clostridia bacterium]|nr:UDP-N-acetylmuramate dehydrogenase [Clostridia bacterium]